jgi:hypothetical protein
LSRRGVGLVRLCVQTTTLRNLRRFPGVEPSPRRGRLLDPAMHRAVRQEGTRPSTSLITSWSGRPPHRPPSPE